MTYETIILTRTGAVALITLNRPQALNALNSTMVKELGAALQSCDEDRDIGAIVITGSEKAFAAGADVKEMAEKTYVDMYLENYLSGWSKLAATRKPLIAAVSGFCLGGGLELALIADMIIASETARFAMPEITLAIMPGAGGTQRLARFIGKAKAMDMILTGRMMEAAEAERCGLVARLVAPEKLQEEAMAAASRIAGYSIPIAMMAKEAVSRSFETSLDEGMRFERRLILSMFATEDQKEGMKAFIEKRKPAFRNR